MDNIKHTNICIIGALEEEKIEKGAENLFEEIMTENFPNLEKATYIQVQSTENLKEDEPKEIHTKTHYN